MMRAGYLFMLFFVMPLDVGAQTEGVVRLEEIEVTGTRRTQTVVEIPFAVSVIEADDFAQAQQQFSPAEFLQRAPGTFVQSRYNFSQDLRLAVRGFGVTGAFGIRGVALVVDGVPMTLPDGQSQIDALDGAAIESVEVLRGPGSVLFGNAAGGVINVVTRSDQPTESARLRVGVGAYGFKQLQASGAREQGSWRYGGRVGHQRWDGYRDHSAARSSSASLWTERRFGDGGRWRIVADALDSPEALDPGGVNASDFNADPRRARDANVTQDAGEQVRQLRVSTSVSGQALGGDNFARVWWVDREFGNRLPFSFGGSVDLDREYRGLQLKHNRRLSDAWNLTLGLDASNQRDIRRRFDNNSGLLGALRLDQKESASTRAAYGQLAFEPDADWSAALGLRRDNVQFNVVDRIAADGDSSGKRDFEETSFSIGFTKQLSQELSAYGSAGRSFATPTTTELANPSGAGFNDALSAQTADQIEVGARAQFRHIQLQLAAYRIELEGELIPFELEDQPGRTFFRNAGSSTRRGVEVELDWAITSALKFSASWSPSRFRFDEFRIDDAVLDGNRLPGAPTSLLDVRLGWQAEGGATVLGAVRQIGNVYADNSNTTEVDGYRVFDASVSWPLASGRWTGAAFAGINNVFDEQYQDNIRINAFGARYFEAGPDRHFYVGIRMGFQ